MAWRWRHLIAAVCVGIAVVAALGILRPAAASPRDVVVLARGVQAGDVLTASDLEHRQLPALALPEGDLGGEEMIGRTIALALPAGTILTPSMTAGQAAAALRDDERLVQVPVGVGADLAEPGALVDLIAPADPSQGTGQQWSSPGASASQQPGGSDGTSTDAGASAETAGQGTSTSDGTAGAQTGGAGQAGSLDAAESTMTATTLCSRARVVSVARPAQESSWLSATSPGAMVTLVTLAVPMEAAPVIVGVATSGSLGLVLSPL